MLLPSSVGTNTMQGTKRCLVWCRTLVLGKNVVLEHLSRLTDTDTDSFTLQVHQKQNVYLMYLGWQSRSNDSTSIADRQWLANRLTEKKQPFHPPSYIYSQDYGIIFTWITDLPKAISYSVGIQFGFLRPFYTNISIRLTQNFKVLL